MPEPLLDPDCAAGKCGSCVGGPCEHWCHAVAEHTPPDDTTPAKANFEGHENRECGEHRTVGPHRAWCHDCSMWCYPHDPCFRCKPSAALPDDTTEALREQHRRDLAAVYAERDEMWERKVAALRERDEARRELERLQAAIERVRAVHVVSDIGECTDCRASWPCPTVAALDGGE